MKPENETARKSDMKLRDVLEASPIGIAILDRATGQRMFINTALANIFGAVSREELLSQDISETWVNSDDLKRAMSVFQNNQSVVNYEAERTRRDGTRWWVLMNTQPLIFEGAEAGIVWHIDITDRKRAEEALKESEKLYRNIFDFAPFAIYIQDGKTILEANAAAAQIYGYGSPEAMIGNRVIDMIHPDDRDRYLERLESFQQRNAQLPFVEERRIRPDGSEINVMQSGTRIPWQGRDRILAMSHNITERRQAEVALQDSERNFRAIAEGTPVPLLITRRTDGMILYANPKVGPVLGIPTEALEGLKIQEFFWRSDERDGRAATLEAKGSITETPLEMRRADGRRISTIHSLQRINFAGVDAILGSLNDVTERLRLEEQLRQAQKMEAVGQLTGGVAHEFNNIMAVIMGNAEMLENSDGDAERSKRNIQAIIRSVTRGASLTNRLLAFSRKQPLSPITTNVAELIGGLEDMLKRTLGETIDLRIECTPDLWPALIDPHQFEGALLNLTLNARDAMPEGGMLVIKAKKIVLDEAFAGQQSELTSGDYVEVTARDTGSGMPPEVLDKAFEPFFTTKDVGDGTGLGLSMVHGFAKQSDGHIMIDSEMGVGTTIALYLPRCFNNVSASESPDQRRKNTRGSERILVVEDDPGVREVPVGILGEQGYEVVEAEDGIAAKRLLQDDQLFDLLFTDIALQGSISGVDIAVYAKGQQPNIKVLYTTGYADDALLRQKQLDPAIAVIRKPYRLAELVEKVRAILDDNA